MSLSYTEVSTEKAGGWGRDATAGLLASQASPARRETRMEENIQAKGVHNVYTKEFHASTFSRISVWINHELPPGTAGELEDLVAKAAIEAVKTWVTP